MKERRRQVKSIAINVPDNPVEEKWLEQVQKWFQDKIPFEEMMKSYPTDWLYLRASVTKFLSSITKSRASRE